MVMLLPILVLVFVAQRQFVQSIEMIGLSTERGSDPTAVGGAADVQERGFSEMPSAME